jgi:UDP-N-acetylmuramoyl-L-alanyl-D-glutamate--2,6-diaminopimelate ligase
VPGRLERVPGDQPFGVFVDYAHTDDALANVLGALRPITDGRIILVFGCGGDRDKSKRPRMARVAEEMSEQVIVTSDNPRSEQPKAIIEDILAGFDAASRGRVIVLPDRGEAIARAVELAHPGDAVLIAGKGHETYQVIGDHRIDFDDVRVAGRALAQRKEVRA